MDVDFTAQMEEKLDEVEEGTGGMAADVLRDFYPPFVKDARTKRRKHIEKVEIQDEVSDVPCDKCGAMMVYKMGRFGQFLGLPQFSGLPQRQADPDTTSTRPAPSAARA